jgi:ribosome maturation factor RimP
MITKEQIFDIVLNKLDRDNQFIVDITVKPGNKIVVVADSLKGISVDECVAISRSIEANLDRNIEDYELEVTSPGLTQPFKVEKQYKKNINKEVEVLLKSGIKLKGKLVSVAQNGIDLEEQKKVKAEGSKKKQLITERTFIELENIKYTKIVLPF